MKIKNSLFILSLFLFSLSASAQSETFQLFSKSNARGGFGGLSVNFYNAQKPYIIGEGAALIGNFYFGGYGYGLDIGTFQSNTDNEEYRVSTGTGGILVGGFSNTDEIVALFAETRLGWGEFSAVSTFENQPNASYSVAALTVFPMGGIVIRPFDFLQVRFQAGYAFSGAVELHGINAPFNAGTFGVGLHFGGF